MHHPKKLLVIARWDDEVGVWVATSDDIPGLVTEAANVDDLIKRVMAVVPELLEENAHLLDQDEDVSDLLEVCVSSSFSLNGHHAH